MVKRKPVARIPVKKTAPISALEELFKMGGDVKQTDLHDDMDDELPQTSDFHEGHEVLDFEKLIMSELESVRPVSKDLRIDDSKVPIAKNFFEFTNDETFLNSVPYLEQAIIGIKLMSEYCPKPSCTDLEWFSDDGHTADEPLARLKEKVSLLENGVCPKCGARKSKLIESGELNFYNELVVVAGQRCVTADTYLFTSKGIERIGDINPDAPTAYSKFQKSVYNGRKLEVTEEFYKTKVESVYSAHLANGFSLSGTLDHPILVHKQGWKALYSIRSGDKVCVISGANQWGNTPTDKTFDELFLAGKNLRSIVVDDKIQQSILGLNRKHVHQVLLGAFSEGLTAYTPSESVARDLYIMLLNYGILSTIETNKVVITQTDYDILVTGKHIKRKKHLVAVVSAGITDRKEVMYDVTMPITHQFSTSGILSHNSGKSAVSTMISAYILHLFLMCGKPTELFGIRNNEVLHGTFLALTLGQATQNLWDPFLGYLTNSPWFRSYHALLRKHEKKYGETFLKLKDTFIRYYHRNLILYPATPDPRVLRGRTRWLSVLDELGWFDAKRDSKKVRDNAHEVYKSMSNSLATARQSEKRLVALGYDQFLLTGYMLNVSSPSNIRDKIMELYKQSQGSKKSLGLHKPTWKMNPNIPFDGDLITEEYRKDPIGAARDFGAEPSLSTNPFISNHRLIQETVRPTAKNWCKYALKIIRVTKDEKYRSAELLAVKQNSTKSVMALDAGHVNNCFAITVGSIHDGVPHIDCLIEINALPGIPISFIGIFADVVLPLIQQRNVTILLADRWNSIMLLQSAQDSCPQLKISKQYSLKYNDMYDVKTAIEMGQLKIPNIENPNIKNILEHNLDNYPACFEGKPVEHLMLQMATVVDVGKKSVEKGDGFTDDLWRSTALCHWGLTNPEHAEHLAGELNAPAKVQPPLAVVKKFSGGWNALTKSSGSKSFAGSTKFLGVKKTTRS